MTLRISGGIFFIKFRAESTAYSFIEVVSVLCIRYAHHHIFSEYGNDKKRCIDLGIWHAECSDFDPADIHRLTRTRNEFEPRLLYGE